MLRLGTRMWTCTSAPHSRSLSHTLTLTPLHGHPLHSTSLTPPPPPSASTFGSSLPLHHQHCSVAHTTRASSRARPGSHGVHTHLVLRPLGQGPHIRVPRPRRVHRIAVLSATSKTKAAQQCTGVLVQGRIRSQSPGDRQRHRIHHSQAATPSAMCVSTRTQPPWPLENRTDLCPFRSLDFGRQWRVARRSSTTDPWRSRS
jgi:hypothetical protein